MKTQLLFEVDNDRIRNCDETGRKILPNALLTSVPSATYSVSLEAILDEKTAIKALTGLATSMKKLPLYLIAKGLNSRVQATQLGRIQDTKLTSPHRDGE
jgi:hypothetical protein